MIFLLSLDRVFSGRRQVQSQAQFLMSTYFAKPTFTLLSGVFARHSNTAAPRFMSSNRRERNSRSAAQPFSVS